MEGKGVLGFSWARLLLFPGDDYTTKWGTHAKKGKGPSFVHGRATTFLVCSGVVGGVFRGQDKGPNYMEVRRGNGHVVQGRLLGRLRGVVWLVLGIPGFTLQTSTMEEQVGGGGVVFVTTPSFALGRFCTVIGGPTRLLVNSSTILYVFLHPGDRSL